MCQSNSSSYWTLSQESECCVTSWESNQLNHYKRWPKGVIKNALRENFMQKEFQDWVSLISRDISCQRRRERSIQRFVHIKSNEKHRSELCHERNRERLTPAFRWASCLAIRSIGSFSSSRKSSNLLFRLHAYATSISMAVLALSQARFKRINPALAFLTLRSTPNLQPRPKRQNGWKRNQQKSLGKGKQPPPFFERSLTLQMNLTGNSLI